MIDLRRAVIKDLTAVQFYGILSGVRATPEGNAEFNTIENEAIALLNRFTEWGNNPVAGQALQMASKVQDLRYKYQSNYKYEQHSNDETLIRVFRENYNDFFERGLPLSELQKVVNIPNLVKNGHFLQTQMLTDLQSGIMRCAVAEFLESAQYFYNEAWKFYNQKKKIEKVTPEIFFKIPEVERSRTPSENELQIRFFKEAFINLILFVEAFINAVGYDAFLKNKHLSPEEELNLKGQYTKKDGSLGYISIRNKIKVIPRIITGDSNAGLNDKSEPYKTYFENFVELRNSYMHTSPAKGSTWFCAEDWKTKNDILIDNICFSVVKGFWEACYPSVTFPVYLRVIYYSDGFVGRTKKFFPSPS